MLNISILFLTKIYDFHHSSLASSFFIKGQNNYNNFSLSNSKFNFFSQSLIKVHSMPIQKRIFVHNSLFQYFLRSPIKVHNKDENKIKLFEDLTYKNKRFKIKGGTLTVIRCIFSNNQAKKGGGLNAEHNLCVNLTDCAFSSNIATFGGGFYIEQADSASLSRILILNNSAEYLGGLFLDGNLESSELFSYVDNLNATFNSAKEWTGGVRFDHGGGFFINSVISFNSARVCGGFFDQSWKPSKRFIQYALFLNNSAADRVGAYCAFHIMHQSKFENCIFVKNECSSSCSSIFIESIDSVVEVVNCFFDESIEKSLKMKFEFSKFILDGNSTFDINFAIDDVQSKLIIVNPNTQNMKQKSKKRR